jgi:hypothetical protein
MEGLMFQYRYGMAGAFAFSLIVGTLFLAYLPPAKYKQIVIQDYTGEWRKPEECHADWRRPTMYCEVHFLKGRPGTHFNGRKVICGCFDDQTLAHWEAASNANYYAGYAPTQFLPEPYDESQPIPLWGEVRQ